MFANGVERTIVAVSGKAVIHHSVACDQGLDGLCKLIAQKNVNRSRPTFVCSRQKTSGGADGAVVGKHSVRYVFNLYGFSLIDNHYKYLCHGMLNMLHNTVVVRVIEDNCHFLCSPMSLQTVREGLKQNCNPLCDKRHTEWPHTECACCTFFFALPSVIKFGLETVYLEV